MQKVTLPLKIVKKGNSIQSLAIEDDAGNKLCSGIALRNIHVAKLFQKSPELAQNLAVLLSCVKNLNNTRTDCTDPSKVITAYNTAFNACNNAEALLKELSDCHEGV